MADYQDFFTREKANDGVVLPLTRPDGTETEHWIKVRGVDSDEFRRANARAKREVLKIAAIKSDQEREVALDQMELELRAALVLEWSFKDLECTPENVRKFLADAPQIADEIDRQSSRRTLFFAKESVSSANLREANSN